MANPTRPTTRTPSRPPGAPGAARPGTPRKPMTAHRVRRRFLRAALLAGAVLGGAYLAVTRGGVATPFVLSKLRGVLAGSRLDVAEIFIASDGGLVLEGVRLTNPELVGEAGAAAEFLTVERVEVEVDWLATLTGTLTVRRVLLEAPVIRVSQDAGTGALSVTAANLLPATPRTKGGAAALESLRIVNGELEVGEHGVPPDAKTTTGPGPRAEGGRGQGPADEPEQVDPGYRRLARVPITGALLPSEGDEGRYVVDVDALVEGRTITARGRIDERGLALSISGLKADAVRPELVPTYRRKLWEDLALSGGVTLRTLDVSAEGRPRVTLDLEGVGVTLPFDELGGTSREYLRLNNVVGSLTLDGDRAAASLEGEAESLRYRVDLETLDLTGEVGFLCRVRTMPFRLRPGVRLLQFVPPVVNDKLELFEGLTADVTSETWLAQRWPGLGEGPLAPGAPGGAPARDGRGLTPPAELRPSRGEGSLALWGRILMRNGSTAYTGFPYAFRGMLGEMIFDRDRLEIRSVTGVAPGGARISATGSIAPLGGEAEVDLDVKVNDLPIDQALREALGPERRGLINALFSEEQHAALVAEGLLRTAEQAAETDEALARRRVELEAWAGRADGAAGEQARLAAEIAALEREAASAPAFALGGLAQVDVKIRRELGEISIWTRDITIRMPRAGLISQYFPLPVIGSNVELWVTNGRAEMRPSTFRTLAAADASAGTGQVRVSALADLSPPEPGEPPRLPAVRVDAWDVPVDRLLLRAIPGPGGLGQDDVSTSFGGILDNLGLRGRLDASADIRAREDAPTELGYRIEVALKDMAATPVIRPGLESLPPMRIEGINGSVYVDQSLIVLDVTSRMFGAPTGDEGAAPSAASRGDLLVQADLPEGHTWTGGPKDAPGDGPGEGAPRPSAGLFVRARGLGADVATPVEHLIALVSEEAAASLLDLRRRYEPTGRVDLTATASGRVGERLTEDAGYELRTGRVDRLAFNAFGGRVGLDNGSGRLDLVTGREPAVEFHAFDADLAFNGEPAGRLRVDGRTPLRPPDAPGAAPLAPLTLSLSDGRFESAMTRTLVADRLGAELARAYERFEPRGRYDLSLDIVPFANASPPPAPTTTDGTAGAAADGSLSAADVFAAASVRGELRPRSVTLRGKAGPVEATSVEGTLNFHPRGGTFRGLRAANERWSVLVDGAWATPEPSVLDLEAAVAVEAQTLPADLLGLLPSDVAGVLAALGAQSDGPVHVRDARVLLRRPQEAASADLLISGAVDVEQGRLDLGFPVTELDATVAFEAWRRAAPEAAPAAPAPAPRTADTTPAEPAGAEPTAEPSSPMRSGFTLTVDASRLRAAGVRATGVHAVASRAGDGTGVLIPEFGADVHGGRVAGWAFLREERDAPADASGRKPLRYWSELSASAVAVEGVLADVQRATVAAAVSPGSATDGGNGAAPIEPDAPTERDATPGDAAGPGALLDFGASLSAVTGDDTTRRGTGRIVASGGPLLRFPLLLSLVEVSNLQPPSGAQLSLGRASFSILGDEITFDEIAVFSDSVALFGYGSMDWPTRGLDLRFNSRPLNPLPIISDVLVNIRDEIITTRVGGTLASPDVSAEPLSATRRLIGAILGTDDAESRKLRAIEREARAARDASRLVPERTDALRDVGRPRQADPAATPGAEQIP